MNVKNPNHIHLKNVYYFYQNKEDIIIALRGITASFNVNQISVIMGPSGSGKSTLLNIIRKHIKPSSGEINYFFNKKSKNLKIGYVDQFSYKLFQYSNNVKEAIQLFKNSKPIDKSELEQLGLKTLEKNSISTLSFGEAQRLALFIAIQIEPDILILDEPTAQLDSENTKIIFNWLVNLKTKNKIIILASHDERAKEISDQLILLNYGFIEGDQIGDSDVMDFKIPSIEGGAIKLPTILWEHWNRPTEIIFKVNLNTMKVSLKPLINRSKEEIKFPWSEFLNFTNKPWIKLSNLKLKTPNGRMLIIPTDINEYGGHMIGLIGPSGSGKSTFIEFISGTLSREFISSGNIQYSIHDFETPLCCVQQKHNFPDNIILDEILEWLLYDKEKRTLFLNIVSYFDFSIKSSRKYVEYSGGQKYLISFAIALARNPAIIILDETFANFDKSKTSKGLKVLKKLKEKGRIIIIATHDPEIINFVDASYFFNKNMN